MNILEPTTIEGVLEAYARHARAKKIGMLTEFDLTRCIALIESLIAERERLARIDTYQSVIDKYGDFNDGCGCCSSEDLKKVIGSEIATLQSITQEESHD
jgi:hypothetical protein